MIEPRHALPEATASSRLRNVLQELLACLEVSAPSTTIAVPCSYLQQWGEELLAVLRHVEARESLGAPPCVPSRYGQGPGRAGG
jgi:hypothetical protein